MIGSAKITYTNENVCQLVRKDLVDKFGNRELANYNLYLPGVIRSKAVVSQFPNPDVQIESIEDQVREIYYPGRPVARTNDSVKVVPSAYGKAPISSVFDAKAHVLTVSGGPIPYSEATEVIPEAAHYYRISVGFPAGFNFVEDDLLGFSVNGRPQAHVVSVDEEQAKALFVDLDGKFTSVALCFNWNDDNAPELISVINNATLENQAIEKVPAFPTEPKITFVYPTDYAVDSNVQVDVDLDLGKE